MHTNFNSPTHVKFEPLIEHCFDYKNFPGVSENEEYAFWHSHDELEITFINGGCGLRHIGRHLSSYSNGDLLFIGPNIPHNGFTNYSSQNKSETIIHFSKDFVGATFFNNPETRHIQSLFERADYGISFKGKTKSLIGMEMEEMKTKSRFDQLIILLKILNKLAQSEEYILLNSTIPSIVSNPLVKERLGIIYSFVRENFKSEIRLSDIARLSNLNTSSFCRFFKIHTGRNFTRFVNEFRIVYATKLLAEDQSAVTEICFESGFNNFSYFNRIFKELTGKSPTNYRNDIQILVK